MRSYQEMVTRPLAEVAASVVELTECAEGIRGALEEHGDQGAAEGACAFIAERWWCSWGREVLDSLQYAACRIDPEGYSLVERHHEGHVYRLLAHGDRAVAEIRYIKGGFPNKWELSNLWAANNPLKASTRYS